MIDIKPASLSYNGKLYYLELGTVDYTYLGFEDHGIFAANIDFDFGGHGQGTGFVSLCDFASIYIKDMLSIFGRSYWENIKDSQIYVLRHEPYGQIKGLLNMDQTSVLIFDELFDRMKND